jgi:hypothetical protein
MFNKLSQLPSDEESGFFPISRFQIEYDADINV